MSLRAGWIGWRNRLLMSARFQALAARTPGLRWKARAEAAALFDLVAGFVYSQVLKAVVELDLCGRLRDGPMAASALAAATGLDAAATTRLLRAAAALGLVESTGGAWALGPRGAALLGNPGVAAMIAHHGALYADLGDPVGLLLRGRGEALADYWAYARGGEPAAVAAYSQLMAASVLPVAQQALGATGGLRGCRRLLDVGGGEGAFVGAVATAVPGLDLALFDLPAVAARARARLDAQGLQRVAVHGGSFFDDALPTGFDLITLVRILHDHDDGPARALLRAARMALSPGARLMIAEPMAGETPNRVGDAYFGLYLLAMGSGRARTPGEITTMLKDAGFASSRRLRTDLPLVASVIVATA